MIIVNMKEKYMNMDWKSKMFLFLGIILLATTLPEGLILPLGVLVLITIFSKNLLKGFLYIFTTLFRLFTGVVVLLLAFYVIMVIVVYFLT
ncbi:MULTISPECIES: hypothetical protein [Planococcus]|uniref:hypothetical protein n=1 Tax=Planococcus TaxID=1372 RepID=UPI00163D556F|nr:hypothetical protein [Planococcus soli]